MPWTLNSLDFIQIFSLIYKYKSENKIKNFVLNI